MALLNNQLKVISKIHGGLGNQMFQYAAGRSLSLRLNCPLVLDTSWFQDQQDRNYELDNFNIKADTISPLNKKFGRLGVRFIRVKDKFFSTTKMGVKLFKEKQFNFDSNFSSINSSVYLDGYWQSELYFEEHGNKIREEFELKDELTSERNSIADKIQLTNAVALHVRRGDYISNLNANKHHGICDMNWYAEMMRKVLLSNKSAKFFVFSDDIDWVRSNIPNKPLCEFVNPEKDGKDFQDLYLMSLCNNHILANSSFSWWSAWLHSGNNQVWAPKKWFANPKMDTSDLIPGSWQQY